MTIEVLEHIGRVLIEFDRAIRVPSNFTEWSSDNEGSDRFALLYNPSYETQTMLYDQDVTNSLKWSVIIDQGQETEPVLDD